MNFTRFGRAAVRLDLVASIREVAAGEPERPGDPVPVAVRVTFVGAESETFDGPDAEALRAFVAAMPAVFDVPEGAFAGEVGRPVRQPRGRKKPG